MDPAIKSQDDNSESDYHTKIENIHDLVHAGLVESIRIFSGSLLRVAASCQSKKLFISLESFQKHIIYIAWKRTSFL
jgi:hypothetical protein